MRKNTLQHGLSTLKIVLITIAVTALLVGTGMYFFQRNNQTTEISNTKQPSPTPDESLTLSDTDPTIAAENNTSGRLEGTFIYPSEGIPKSLKACAENTQTAQVFCSGSLRETGFNNTFSFELPAGKYYVYAQNVNEDQQTIKAYYTEFVTCGLLATCPSHKKIVVEVKENETVSDVKPHDWYDVTPTP